jgi:hypothetical protein
MTLDSTISHSDTLVPFGSWTRCKCIFRLRTLLDKCDACQCHKNFGHPYGELAACEAALTPWSEIAVNTISPWTLQVGNQQVKFNALTIIDTVTNLIELVRLDSSSAMHAALQFENTWLAQYPCPMQYTNNSNIVFENKYKFEFKCLTLDVILMLYLIHVQTHM